MKITPEIIAIWQKQGRGNLRTKVKDLLTKTETLVESQEKQDMSTDRSMGVISALWWVMSELDREDREIDNWYDERDQFDEEYPADNPQPEDYEG